MTSYPRAGFFGRLLAALGGGLARGLLGRSAHAHLKQFTGSDEYWDRVIEARRACHRDQPRGAEPGPPGGVASRAAVGDTAGIPPGPEPELMPGWTERRLSDVKARDLTDKVYLRI